MRKGRLEAFSDGVLAIIITIMVLELEAPHEASLEALAPLAPRFVCYALSFVMLGIYWNNHHHLLHAIDKVDGGVMWANLHLLFWLSLVPFATAWMGDTHLAPLSVAAYGVVMLLAGGAYLVLTRALLRLHGSGSTLATAVGRDVKGWSSLVLYALAVPLAFAAPRLACALYALVALIWLCPDRRIERALGHSGTA